MNTLKDIKENLWRKIDLVCDPDDPYTITRYNIREVLHNVGIIEVIEIYIKLIPSLVTPRRIIAMLIYELLLERALLYKELKVDNINQEDIHDAL